MLRRRALTLFFFCSLCFVQTSRAARNITIDNTSSSIRYYGSEWTVAVFPEYDVGGSQHLVDLGPNGSGASTATATFTFTGICLRHDPLHCSSAHAVPSGTAIYYWAPLWPYLVTTSVALDSEIPWGLKLLENGPQVPIGSVGPSVPSAVRWGLTGLANTQHTLLISLTPGTRYIVLDALT